jgi:hypothetical protein
MASHLLSLYIGINMKKTIVSLILGLTLSSATYAETWKFASEEAKNDVQDIYAQKFAEVIKNLGEILRFVFIIMVNLELKTI